jgi:raffinose/stachyose/melibiose transport system permease protein
MEKKTKFTDHIWVVLLSILAVAYMYPIFMILINSLKKERAIGTSNIFSLPTSETFAGFTNYMNALGAQGFAKSLGYSVLITITAVAAILVCCSMCAWYITRVKSRITSFIYYALTFSMIVPFQMVMFTMSKIANMIHIDNPIGIIILYVGFGCGMSTFMFSGFIKSIPLALEEAAMIDGASRLQRIINVDIPSILPTIIIQLIFNCASVVSIGMDKVFLMQNDLNAGVSEVISTFVYKVGVVNSNFGYSTAAGLFQSLVAFSLLIIVNKTTKKLTETSLF